MARAGSVVGQMAALNHDPTFTTDQIVLRGILSPNAVGSETSIDHYEPVCNSRDPDP